MAKTISFTEQLIFEVIHCAHCGCPFGLTDDLVGRRRKDGTVFYCPHGHDNYYTPGPTPAQKLKALQDQLDQQKVRLSQTEADAKWQKSRAENLDRRLSATRGVVTRIKNRVKNGICPECNRSFQDLRRHMECKHPGFGGDDGEA